jgi:hypothetical protein
MNSYYDGDSKDHARSQNMDTVGAAASTASAYTHIHLYMYMKFYYTYFSSGATAPSGPESPHYRRFTITDTPHSVGLLWTSDQAVAETSN